MKAERDWAGPELSAVGALLGDPARVAILMALVGGGTVRPGALARRAGVAPSTGTFHLAKLVEAGWVTKTAQGYRLSSSEVGELLEHLAYLAPPRQVSSLKGHTRRERLRQARCCYDHLAGALGVSLTSALLRLDVIRGGTGCFLLTEAGAERLQHHGIVVQDHEVRTGGRAFARPCLDWSERGYHLGGALGAAVLTGWLEQGFVCRDGDDRAVQVTDAGVSELETWGIAWPPESPDSTMVETGTGQDVCHGIHPQGSNR
jgi:DNA-binding transcriptional ArsR family regulator